ncbi:hypothetical protein LTR35_006793 [Friedmanniomyces endolithicus]|uniref:Uncharacterized protein n=1 Tax=Friedmanniomyces endolithicus TaxID=329885 RepID=A0AAN6JFP9_9PEZI|nr:hypothetical protein LTR35_006793 [Friedmanniomyces endolithicus]KAK0295960.1 hypothetical protein LTS00_005245 [Friedmanniomyces endolithicus]KAK0328069.1 hypothetical protein LTR82_001588 [Friedmanniomyces endolithicus]KAK0990070.1 hypothetical protein LTR54_012295 [Friedmanniomyces endolithicus]
MALHHIISHLSCATPEISSTVDSSIGDLCISVHMAGLTMEPTTRPGQLRTLTKHASLAASALRDPQFGDDNHTTLRVYREAREITVPWLRDLEKDMRERGVWEGRQEGSMHARGHEGRPEASLLHRIGSVVWECIRTSGSSSDGDRTRKKDVLLKRLYGSVLRSVAEADEEIARLERLLEGTHPPGATVPQVGRGGGAAVPNRHNRGPGDSMRSKEKTAGRSTGGSRAPPGPEPVNPNANELRDSPSSSERPLGAQQRTGRDKSTNGDRGLPTPEDLGGRDTPRSSFQDMPQHGVPGKHDVMPDRAGLYNEHGYGSTPETNPAYAWKPPESGDDDNDDTASYVSRVTRAPTLLSQESAPMPVNVGGSAHKRSHKKKGSRSQR